MFSVVCQFLYFLLLPICRTSLSTLFPYTTLFRSHPRRGGVVAIDSCRLVQVVDDDVQIAVVVQIGESQDRKSTRLNSSHLGISYAVFCLKKKNKIFSTRRMMILR